VSDSFWLYAVQALHGVTVVGLNLGSPLYLDDVAPDKLRSTAQAVLSMVSAGIAGMISNIGAGWLMQHGGIELIYWLSGIGCIALASLVGALLPVPTGVRTSASEAAVGEPV
jgi:MFS family permease